jgi:hypothetical protein
MNERKAREALRERSHGGCETCRSARATDYQHRKNRSQGGTWDLSNALHLCHRCHMWIHANPKKANERGWHLKSWQDPAAEPVRLFGRWVLLTDVPDIGEAS